MWRHATMVRKGHGLVNTSSIDLAAFIKQADAAYGFPRAQPAADPRRMLVAGHSEGGMYALLVAGSVSPRPAGLALIEPQDERFLSLIQLQTDEQLDAMAAQDSITAATARQNGRAVRQAIADFRAGRAVVTDGMLPAVVNLLTPILLSEVNAVYVRATTRFTRRASRPGSRTAPASWSPRAPQTRTSRRARSRRWCEHWPQPASPARACACSAGSTTSCIRRVRRTTIRFSPRPW
jgi:pimeloyl-ACP methyl ester carboxylesterase